MRVSVFSQIPTRAHKKAIREIFEEYMEDTLNSVSLVFVHGGSKGAQEICLDVMRKKHTFDEILFQPWHLISKTGGGANPYIMRNQQILANSDLALFFDTGIHDYELIRLFGMAKELGVKTKCFIL